MTVVSDYTALLNYHTWNGEGVIGRSAFVTYSFPTALPDYLSPTYGPATFSSFRALSSSQQDQVRDALHQFEGASGIRFLEIPQGGDIAFQLVDSDTTGRPHFYGFAHAASRLITASSDYDNPVGGTVFFNTQDFSTSSNVLNTALHEIGHAIGLKHPFEGDPTLASSLDDNQHTVMSYTYVPGYNANHLGPIDIDAVQAIYGMPGAFGSHLSSWSWNGQTLTLTQVGTDGADTIVGTSTRDLLNGAAGDDLLWSGAGDDQISGGEGNDTLLAWDGNDIVFAGPGDDLVRPGAGNDEVYAGAGSDTITEYSTVLSNDTLGGGDGNDTVFAGGGSDYVYGGPTGNDYLVGDEGADVIFGGVGMVALNERDSVYAGEGNDTVFAYIGDDLVVGGGGDDLLFGGANNDTIWDQAGRDTIWGGPGNDLLVGDTVAGERDIFEFIAGSGQDQIFNFQHGVDLIVLSDTAVPFHSFADVQAHMSGTSSAIIDLGGGAQLTLWGVSPGTLSAVDFGFLAV